MGLLGLGPAVGAVLLQVFFLLFFVLFFLLSLERDAVLRFGLRLVIGISFGSAATIAATTDAPPQLKSRRGRIPKRSPRLELGTVPLRLREEASPFWIILLLVQGGSEHPMISIAAQE